jgi:hypothetical protein
MELYTLCYKNMFFLLHLPGARSSLVVKALSYEPEGRGFETR